MPQITFRGKIYKSEFEMPRDIRRSYQDYELRKSTARPLADVIDIPAEVQNANRRVLSKDRESTFSQSTNHLATIAQLYHRSAPEDMRHLPSDDSILPLSPPIIDPEYSAIDPEPSHWIVKVVSLILWALFTAVLIYFVTQWVW